MASGDSETPPPGNHTLWVCGQTNIPEAIEAVVGAVDGEDRRPGVGLRHPAISLQHDHLCPNFVVDLVPFVQHLLDVILQHREKVAQIEHIAESRVSFILDALKGR